MTGSSGFLQGLFDFERISSGGIEIVVDIQNQFNVRQKFPLLLDIFAFWPFIYN